jgi:hypothetical protein
VEDARADQMLQGKDQEQEEVLATEVMGYPGEPEGDDHVDGGNISLTDYHNAFLKVLSSVEDSEIKGMPVSLALRCLDREAQALGIGRGECAAAQEGRHFYSTVEDIENSSSHGMGGVLSREEIDAISKFQKKEDADITANIQGRVGTSLQVPRQTLQSDLTIQRWHQDAEMRLEIGPFASYINIALALTQKWALNKLQSMALLLPAAFLDKQGTRLQDSEAKQHFQYVGGEGGTGKSRTIHAIKDMFRLKDVVHTLLLTGASGNAAALIGGVTLHSALNIAFHGRTGVIKNVSEEEKLRWKEKVMLIVDEISQVGGLTLASVDGRLRQYRDDADRPFGGIPIVIFFGDFFQFDPVKQTSLLLAQPKDCSTQKPESLAKHIEAHKLFLRFTSVVILREQVRTARCPRLRGFLQRLRNGEQSELDFERLCRRLYNPSSQATFANGLRAITPLNQDRWDLNMAAVVQWARAHGKHISIFVAKHRTEAGRQLQAEDLYNVLRYGDDSQLPTPGLFFYAQGMPVVVTRNQFTGLKVVNGAPFEAVDIFPDPAAGTIALASDATLHLGPPEGVLIQSSETADIAIPGLPRGTILLKSKTVAIPDAMRGKERRLRGKPGFRWVTHRTGPQCTPAFAMTDQKSQGKQFSEVLVNLKGVHGSSTATRPSFMSLYVQLSRAETWNGLYLFRKPARSDFIEPRNVLDKDMRDAVSKLESLGDDTKQRFEQDYNSEAWFAAWKAMTEPNTHPQNATADQEDNSSW